MKEEASKPLIDPNLNYFKPQWKNFSLSELQAATSNFCQGYLIGKGGYAEVYRGRLLLCFTVQGRRLSGILGTKLHLEQLKDCSIFMRVAKGGSFIEILRLQIYCLQRTLNLRYVILGSRNGCRTGGLTLPFRNSKALSGA